MNIFLPFALGHYLQEQEKDGPYLTSQTIKALKIGKCKKNSFGNRILPKQI